MKKNVFPTIFFGVLVFWIPLLLVVFAYKKLSPIFQALGEPVKRLFPNNGFFGYLIDVLFFLLLILLVSYVIGWVARKTILKKWGEKVDQWLGRLFPSYAFRRNYLKQESLPNQKQWKPVVLELEDESFGIGFAVEEQEGALCVVFVPHAPEVSTGEILLVKRERLRFLDAPFFEVVKAIRAYGVGLSELCNK